MYGNNNTNLVYILQYILYCSGFNPNGFDGAFGNGVKTAVTNFQNFVKLTADGVCGQQTWASLMSSAGDTTRNVTACDTRFEITDDRAKLLVKNGYKIVGRYIVGGDFKELRENEPEVLFNNGLKFFPIFQEDGTSEDNYSISTGIKNAQRANMAVKKHKIPKGSTVYFAVDFDCLDYQITRSIIPYFIAVREYFDPNYEVGIYATRNTCQRVCDSAAGVTSCFISDMSTGYSGNLGYFLPSNWNYDQIANVTLNDIEYGSLEIDKVVYSGIIPAINQLEVDDISDGVLTAYTNLTNIYDIALEYTNRDYRKSNLLTLQYIRRHRYGDRDDWGIGTDVSNIKWDIVAGVIDEQFCNLVDSKLSNLNLDFSDSPMNLEIFHDFPHLAATLNALLYPVGSDELKNLDEIVDAYAGWAGDAVSFATAVSDAVNNGITTDYEQWAINKICRNNNPKTNFDVQDYIDDIDAYNLYYMINIKGKNLPDAFYDYYILQAPETNKCAFEQRAVNFINYMTHSKFTQLCEKLISDESPIKELKLTLTRAEQKYIDAAMNAFEKFIINEYSNGR